MITREEIRSIPRLYKLIQRKTEQLRYLQEKATSVPSGLSEGERVQSSPDNSAGRYVEAAADLQREIGSDQAKLGDLQRRASIFIDTVEDPLAVKILRYRYLDCCTWEEVADLTGYVVRWVCKIESEVINNNS